MTQLDDMFQPIDDIFKRLDASITPTVEKMAKSFIYLQAELYHRDRNPLRVYEAYRLARKHNLRTPSWVSEYFDRLSKSVLSAITPKRSRDFCEQALGITMHHFDEFEKSHQALETVEMVLYQYVQDRRRHPNPKMDPIFDEVVKKLSISKSTVLRRFEKYGPEVMKNYFI